MRTVDRSTRTTRRTFLRRAAGAPAAAALVGATDVTQAWAQDAKSLAPHEMATLVKLARDIFPHDHIGDIFYVRAVQPYDEKAGKDPAVKAMISSGVARLDGDAKDQFGVADFRSVPWEADRLVLLRGIERTAFFKTLRADLVVSLYNQPELWPKLGYEGSSAEYGGYLNRGFNDIDWLPTT